MSKSGNHLLQAWKFATIKPADKRSVTSNSEEKVPVR